MLIISLFFIISNIFIFRYYIFPQYIKSSLHAQIEKIDTFFIKHINYISNILEYVNTLILSNAAITNDFLDNLRFQSNIFSRYKNIWNSLLIINAETFHIENMIAYNASIVQLLDNNELRQIFNLRQILNHCYLCFLDEILINNTVYLPVLYKTTINERKKIIIIIIDLYMMEKELQKNIISSKYINLSFSYLNKLKNLKDNVYTADSSNMQKITWHNREEINYSKIYNIFAYDYSIPGTAEHLRIMIDYNYKQLLKQNFLESLYVFLVCISSAIIIIIIINHYLKKNINQSMESLQHTKYDNQNNLVIEEIYFLIKNIKKYYIDILDLQEKNKIFKKNIETCEKKQRNISLALENSLQYREIYHNSLIQIIIENKFHLDYLQYQKNIIHNNKEKEDQLIEFIAIAGHEIKTPLCSIIGFAEILNKYYCNMDAKVINYINHIDECSNYILRLINELIYITKINDGSIRIKRKILPAQELITQCIRYVSQQAETKNITIIQNIDPSIPHIFFDPQHIKQIIINILINSINYSPNNTEISITINKNKHGLNITIIDNGYGINAKDIASITNKYWSNNGQYKKGFGLGLFLVKKLVEIHQGKMIITSAINQGTTTKLIFSNHFSIM